MLVQTITCDQCEKVISTTGNCQDYRIVVKSESIPVAGGSSTAMAVSPEFKQPLHFCGNQCMRRWAMKYFGLTNVFPPPA